MKLSHKRFVLGLICWVGIITTFTSCSLEVPKQKRSLKIIIEDPNASIVTNAPFSLSSTLSNVFALPSTTADFNCFAVNVAGVGIPSASEKLVGCVNNTNIAIGRLSALAQRGNSFELDVPAGSNRLISVLGVYPSTSIPECGGVSSDVGGAGSGYVLGSKIMDLVATTNTVTIPIQYTGASPDLTCTGNNQGITISSVFPSGGSVSTSININSNGGLWFGGVSITVGGLACNSPLINASNAHTVSCTAPASGLTNGSSYDVVITNGDGKQYTLVGGYTQVGSTSYTTFDGNPDTDALGHTLNFGQVALGGSRMVTFRACNSGSANGSFFSNPALPTDFTYPANAGSFPGIASGDPVYGSNRCPSSGTFTSGGCCYIAVTYTPSSTSLASGSAQFVNADSSSNLTFMGRGL